MIMAKDYKKNKNQGSSRVSNGPKYDPNHKKQTQVNKVNGGVFEYTGSITVTELSKQLNVPVSDIIKYLDKRAKDFAEIVFGHRDLNIYLDGNDLDISYNGKMFDNLSGGEKTRVDLITQFAIRDLLTTYLNASSNILVLDEVTDFLDKTSCDAVMNLIEKELKSVESVFIISHHADELNIPVDSELKVIKGVDGISTIC